MAPLVRCGVGVTLGPSVPHAAHRGELYNKALELQKQGRELIFTNGAQPAAGMLAG